MNLFNKVMTFVGGILISVTDKVEYKAEEEVIEEAKKQEDPNKVYTHIYWAGQDVSSSND